MALAGGRDGPSPGGDPVDSSHVFGVALIGLVVYMVVSVLPRRRAAVEPHGESALRVVVGCGALAGFGTLAWIAAPWLAVFIARPRGEPGLAPIALLFLSIELAPLGMLTGLLAWLWVFLRGPVGRGLRYAIAVPALMALPVLASVVIASMLRR
jgi:hypothetical protein